MRAGNRWPAFAALAIVIIMVLSYTAYYFTRPRPTLEPPSSTLLSSYLGGTWTLNSSRSFIATFDVSAGKVHLSYLNGTTKYYNLSEQIPNQGPLTYAIEFEMPGANGRPNGGLPLWVRNYAYTGPSNAYLVLEVFRANSTQLQWTLDALEAKFGPPSIANGVKYYVERPYLPLLKTTYVYAIYRDYLLVVGTNTSAPESSLASLAVSYALSLP
ncbi:MAG: hypothetical protein ACP5HK_02055 [Acidilobus sp.]